MRISELAKRTGCQAETVRYYEQAGLLPNPLRSAGNYRSYDDQDVERLAFIRHCRSLDMALEEIRALLRFRDAPEQNCEDVNTLLDEHVGHVAERLAELKRLEKELKRLRRLCGATQAAKNCGILKGLSKGTATSKRARARTGHVGRAHTTGKADKSA